jgi:hypothetical protein
MKMARLVKCAAICMLLVPAMASAISVTAGGTSAALIAALSSPGSGLTITSLSINGQTFGAGTQSFGTYTNASGTYGIGGGIMISSGEVANYGDGPNTSSATTTSYGTSATAAQAAVLTSISGAKPYLDVTEIDITFDLDATHSTVFFNVVFGSEEFPEFVGSTFIDGFGMLVNGSNVAFVAGLPVNVDHPSMAALAGTELDGVLAPSGSPTVTFSKLVGAGTTGNTLKFIIADSGDSALDSVAYISALGGTPPPPVPEPASVVLLTSAMGLVALLKHRSRK